MKTSHLITLFGAGLTAVSAPVALAGSFSADFNSGATPAGAALFSGNPDGTAGVIETNGGVGDSGCLKLTKAVNGVTGSMVIGDLDSGAAVKAFEATFMLRVGGGTSPPADGMSFCFANNLPDGTFGEGGAGSGLRVGLDIYDNPDDAPALKIYWNGNRVATTGRLPLSSVTTGSAFAPVLIRINPTGTLDVTFGGNPVFTNLAIGYTPIAGGRFGLGGRTGGLNTNQFVDDLVINTTLGDFLDPAVLTPPRSQTIVSGYPAYLNVGVNDAANATYQWEKKTPADGGFSPIAGATEPTLSTATLSVADTGVQYRVVVSNPAAASVTSAPATLSVVALPSFPTPTVSFNFDDGATPSGSNAYGNAAPIATGGFGDSGYMQLTEAVNGQAGTWTVSDLNGGLPVESIDVSFKLLMTPNPGQGAADGFGFHWAPDLPASGFPNAEEPVGTGLSIGFDVYDNGGGEAPALDVFWLRNRVGGIKLPSDVLNTDGQFADVRIKLAANGKLDVAFNGELIGNQISLPNWTAFSSASYGFSARTGGVNQRQSIDDVQIKSALYTGPIGFVAQPVNKTTVPGHGVSFSVISNDPTRSDYQWQVSVANGAFTNISGANEASYTTPLLAATDNGNRYRCRISRNSGAASTADSTPATLEVYDLVAPGSPQIADTFNNGTDADNTGSVPAAGHTFSGDYSFENAGPDGYLVLTQAANGKFGTMVVDDFNAAAPIGGFTASIKTQLVGNNPADGWSFSWGRNISQSISYGGLESGVGDDLRVGNFTYGGGVRGIRVYWRGTEIANSPQPLELMQSASGSFEEFLVRVNPAVGATPASVDVAHDGVLIARAVPLPGLLGISGARFAIAARTGGLNELHAYDDFKISTTPYVGPITISSQSSNVRLVRGTGTTVSVASSDPPRTTYQWQQAAPGSSTFTNIPGANAATYTVASFATTDNGIGYQCILTSPQNVVTSNPVRVEVLDPALPTSWERTINFDNGELPGQAATYGSAAIVQNGGVLDSGALRLTEAANGQQGAMKITDQDFGNPVTGFVTRFFMRIGKGTNPPADGCSFVWSPEAINGGFGEGGTGSGLTISFNIYGNFGISAFWRGDSLGKVDVARPLLISDNDFREVIVRVNPSGTLDVLFENQIIYWHQPLAGLTPLKKATFGWGGRTGGLNAEQVIDSVQLTTFTDKPWVDASVTDTDLVVSFDSVLETSPNLTDWTAQPAQTSPLILPLSGLSGHQYFRSRRP